MGLYVSGFDLQTSDVSAALVHIVLIYDLHCLILLAIVKSHGALTVIDRFHKSAILAPTSF